MSAEISYKHQDSFHIVLVEPDDNANIGAVARAMKNLGFHNLHLVAPRRYEIERASITACSAVDILQSALFHESLEVALRPMQDVIGFSARHGKNRNTILFPKWLSELQITPPVITALLFGPEECGLTDEHVKYCRRLITIPSSKEFSSFNLAQAVLIVLYEISKSPQEEGPPVERAPWEEFQHLDKLIDQALTDSGFYNEGTPPQLPNLIKTLFRRIHPDLREMRILQGIFGSLLGSSERRISKEPNL